MCFYLKGKKLYLNMHIGSIAVPVLLQGFRTLDKTAEVFKFSQKNNFVTDCGRRIYVYFGMLITWVYGRGAPMERNH